MHSFKGYQAHMDIFECPVWTAFVVLPTHSLFVVRYLFNFHSRIPKNRKTSRSWDCRNRTRDNPDISRVFYHWIKSQYSDRYEIWTRATTVKGWCLTARLTDHNRHKTVSNMFFVPCMALSCFVLTMIQQEYPSLLLLNEVLMLPFRGLDASAPHYNCPWYHTAKT